MPAGGAVAALLAARRRRFAASALALSAALAALGFAHTVLGSGFLCIPWTEMDATCRLLLELRLGRVSSGVWVGAALGLSGALLQSATRNPLAEPAILGVSSGALAAYAAAALATHLVFYDRLAGVAAAFAGALAAYAATLAIAERGGGTASSLILAGVAVTALTSGVAQYLAFLVQAKYGQPFLVMLLGTLAYTRPGDAAILAAVTLAGLASSLLLGRGLNALMVGDSFAHQLGYEPRRLRRLASSTAALLASATVAVAGLIGFVGLIAPHIARALAGGDHRLHAPLSALIGAAVVSAADLGARIASYSFGLGELPVGVYTSVLGGAFLAYLLGERLRGRLEAPG